MYRFQRLAYILSISLQTPPFAYSTRSSGSDRFVLGSDADHEVATLASFPTHEAVHAAEDQVTSWGLGLRFQFAELADTAKDLQGVLNSLDDYSAAVVVLPGLSPPDRPLKEANAQFLMLLDGNQTDALATVLPIAAINRAAASASSIFGRPLYPFRLQVVKFNKTCDQGPWVLYHVPSGTVCLDQSVLNKMQELPFNLATHVEAFTTQLFKHLPTKSTADDQQAGGVAYLTEAFSTAAAAASLVLASQIPVWFCIGCPIVLGMLFPFAFNFGLGAIADELCTHYNLPADECNQLWYSAFALAMILSFASVIPIVSICKLAQCAKHSSPSPSLS